MPDAHTAHPCGTSLRRRGPRPATERSSQAALAQGVAPESTPRFDVRIDIEADGSIAVSETIVQDFGNADADPSAGGLDSLEPMLLNRHRNLARMRGGLLGHRELLAPLAGPLDQLVARGEQRRDAAARGSRWPGGSRSADRS